MKTMTSRDKEVLREELELRVNDWRDVLENEPDNETAKERISVLEKTLEIIGN